MGGVFPILISGKSGHFWAIFGPFLAHFGPFLCYFGGSGGGLGGGILGLFPILISGKWGGLGAPGGGPGAIFGG